MQALRTKLKPPHSVFGRRSSTAVQECLLNGSPSRECRQDLRLDPQSGNECEAYTMAKALRIAPLVPAALRRLASCRVRLGPSEAVAGQFSARGPRLLPFAG